MNLDQGVLDALKNGREVELSVKGRITGNPIPRQVWFVLSKDERSILFIP